MADRGTRIMKYDRDTILEFLEDLGYYDKNWEMAIKDEFMVLLKMKWEAEVD